MSVPLEHGHTIILIQPKVDKITRTWFDFNSETDALKGICTIFENCLRDLNPGQATLTYEVADLFGWVDGLADLSMLVFSSHSKTFTPMGSGHIKNKLFEHMSSIRDARRH